MNEQKSLGQIAFEVAVRAEYNKTEDAATWEWEHWEGDMFKQSSWQVAAHAVASTVRAQCIEAVKAKMVAPLPAYPMTEAADKYNYALRDAIAAIEQLEQPK